MAVITKAFTPVDGQIIYASSINRLVDDLYTLQAGNINSANIGSSGIGASNLETSAVTNRILDDGSVDADKIDFEIKLYNEVFS